MKRTLLILIFIFFISPVKGQEISKENNSVIAKNNVYASLGGPGIYFSLIYERIVLNDKKFSLGIKGGIGTGLSSVLFPDEFNFPIGVYFLYGKRNSHLDLSMNVTSYLLQQYDYTKDNNYKELRLLVVPSVSYRYQKPEGGFLLRAGFSPIININSITNSFVPWIDISIGWSF